MKVYLIPASQIKEYSVVDENVDDKFINVAIIDSQEQLLEPIIGSVLYDKLIHDTANALLGTDYQYLLVEKIWPYLMQATQYKLALNLIYRLTNSSVVKDSNEISTAISIQELNVIRQERENSMRYHEDKLIKYLRNNQTKFPEYTQVDITGNASSVIYQPINFYSEEGEVTIDQLRAAGFSIN